MQKKRIFQILFFIVIFCVIGLFWYFDLGRHITLENLKQQSDYLKQLVNKHFAASAAIFALTYILMVAFFLPGEAILSIAGGFLFGMGMGTFLNVVSATIGAIAVFLTTRFLIGTKLQQKFSKQLTIFNQEFRQYGVYYLFAVRLFPLFPFFLVNILCGLTTISLQTFFITTALGIIPGAMLYTYAGTQLALIKSTREIFSGRVLFAFFLLACFVLILLLIKRIWQKK